jgi:hypothetical protein
VRPLAAVATCANGVVAVDYGPVPLPTKPTRGRARKVRPIPKGRRTSVHREEFDKVIDLLNKRGEILNDMLRTQEIQFQRIAQIQADLDLIKRAWTKLDI